MNAPVTPPDYQHSALFPQGEDTTPYRKLTSDHVKTAEFNGEEVLVVEPEGLRLLAEEAFKDINHFLRPGHLEQLLQKILDDPEASDNDRFVAL
jgi:fumarate hydratase class I